ncbi:MAG: HupE/UreJ family protein [Labilithrix sp.]|nr:HupE/UreJ family protein [Labilithrix sp.]
MRPATLALARREGPRAEPRKRAWWTAFATLALLLFAGRAGAHGARTVTLNVEPVSATEARLLGDARLRLAAPGCSIEPEAAPVRVLRCPRGIGGQAVEALGLGESIDLVIVRVGAEEGSLLTASAPVARLPDAAGANASTALRFARLGVEHVLSGLDHVLFLVALFWQARRAAGGSLRAVAAELLRTSTAFTIAHSLTLATTVIGWLRVSTYVSEALIAASLVLVALDVPDDARAGGVPSRPRDARLVRSALAAAFGLVHGLGFAGALDAAQLPRGALALALFSFNAGVELAQALAFAGCVLVTLVLARRPAGPAREARARLASAYLVGVAGVVLFLSRVSALLRG